MLNSDSLSSIYSMTDSLRLVLVIPFTAKDANHVEDRLLIDWKYHPPCDMAHQSTKDYVDLILYYDGYIDHDIRERGLKRLTVSRLRDMALKEWGGKCFGKIRVMEAGLSGLDNVYPIGASNMFFKGTNH